ncbi:MAG: hypothetical protein IJD92_02510 [Bacilli bacterium]|nr:hypothetical protein [Bacilli bacterium]
MNNKIFKNFSKKILKSEAFISVVIVFVLALGIIGTSYALYMDVDTDTDYQLVNVGDLAISFENGSNIISLTNLLPLEDSDAVSKSDNIYSFNIYNTGTYNAYYNIKLVTMDGNEVESNYINYQFCKTIGEGSCFINTLSNKENGVIYKDMLEAKDPNQISTNPYSSYMLRVWINNQYISEEAKNVKLKVIVEAVNKDNNSCSDGDCGGVVENLNMTCEKTSVEGYEVCYPTFPDTYTLADIDFNTCINDIDYSSKIQDGTIMGVKNFCYLRPTNSTNMKEWQSFYSNLSLNTSVSTNYKYDYSCDIWSDVSGTFSNLAYVSKEIPLIDEYKPKIYDKLGNDYPNILLTSDLTNVYYCDNYHGKKSIKDALDKELIVDKGKVNEDDNYKYYEYFVTDKVASNSNSYENGFIYDVKEEKVNSCSVPVFENVGEESDYLSTTMYVALTNSDSLTTEGCIFDDSSLESSEYRKQQMTSYIDKILGNYTLNGVSVLEHKGYISVSIGSYQVYQYGVGEDLFVVYELQGLPTIDGKLVISYYNSCDGKMYNYQTNVDVKIEYKTPCE